MNASSKWAGVPVLGGRLPILGHLHRLYGDQLTFFRELGQRSPLYWVDAGFGDWIVLWFSPDSLEILRHAASRSHHLQERMFPLLGTSMITQDGEAHRRVRGVMGRPLSPTGLHAANVGRVMADVMATRVAAIVDQARPILLDETRAMALAILFGIIGADTAELKTWSKAYEQLLWIYIPRPLRVPGTPGWRAGWAKQWIDGRLTEMIESARAAGPDHPGLLPHFVSAHDEHEHLNNTELLDNLRLLVLAGHETTASTATANAPT